MPSAARQFACLAAVALALSALLAAPARAADAAKDDLTKKFKTAQDYLEEVQKHLQVSYVDGPNLKAAGLVQAARSGMRKLLASADAPEMEAEVMDALREYLKSADTRNLGELLQGVRNTAKEAGATTLDVQALSDAAAREMVALTGDPFSQLMTDKEVQKLMEMLFGQEKDKSIGLSIRLADGEPVIAYVMFGYPAYDAGLEIGDTLLAVNEKPVKDVEIKALQKMIQIEKGKSITLRIRRPGAPREYDFVIKQTGRRGSDVLYTMLPGKVGYLRLTVFDLNLSANVKKALKALSDDGMEALLLDLRHNPGGALPASVAVADQFIGGKQLITRTESKYKLDIPLLKNMIPEQPSEYWSKPGSPFEEMPMAVLIDHSSASASELLSGALQDTKRAPMIGETTYGKGVGQTAIPLMKSGGNFMMPKRFLYLTVLRYYLPSGRSIHHKGVEPDIAVADPKPDPKQFDALWTLRERKVIEKYVGGLIEADEENASALAEYDGFETSRYAGFKAWRSGLDVDLPEDLLRREVRKTLRRTLETRHGHAPFVADLEDDPVLQAGVLYVAEQLGIGAAGR